MNVAPALRVGWFYPCAQMALRLRAGGSALPCFAVRGWGIFGDELVCHYTRSGA